MSTYGLRIRDASGNIQLDTSNQISRFRYGNLVAADASDSTTLSDISGLSTVEISVMVNIVDWRHVAHSFTRSGTTVTWTAQSGTQYSSNQSIVFLFLYT